MKTAKEMREDLSFITDNADDYLYYEPLWNTVYHDIESGEITSINQILRIMIYDALRFAVQKSVLCDFFKENPMTEKIRRKYNFTKEEIYGED